MIAPAASMSFSSSGTKVSLNGFSVGSTIDAGGLASLATCTVGVVSCEFLLLPETVQACLDEALSTSPTLTA